MATPLHLLHQCQQKGRRKSLPDLVARDQVDEDSLQKAPLLPGMAIKELDHLCRSSHGERKEGIPDDHGPHPSIGQAMQASKKPPHVKGGLCPMKRAKKRTQPLKDFQR